MRKKEDKDKKRKKRDDDFMNYVLQFMEKSLKTCMDQALNEIFKDWGFDK